MRFPMKIDTVWRGPVLIGGATRANSYVEVTDGAVTFRFGALFNRTVPRSEIVEAYRRDWPWWYGIGWRSNLRGVIGLIGSYQGVVEVKLATRQRAWAVFPCDRIAVSLEDPEGFIAALGGGGTAEKSPAAKPKRKAATRKKKAG